MDLFAFHHALIVSIGCHARAAWLLTMSHAHLRYYVIIVLIAKWPRQTPVVKGDLLVRAPLKECSDMVRVLFRIAVVYYDIVNDPAESGEACKGFIHAAIVVF